MCETVKSWCDGCQASYERTGYGSPGHFQCSKPEAPPGYRLTGAKELTENGWLEDVAPETDGRLSDDIANAPAPPVLATIVVGSRTLRVPVALAALVGFTVYADGTTRESPVLGTAPTLRLARALDEMPNGADEAVVLRAIANEERRKEAITLLTQQQQLAETEAGAAKNARSAAGMNVWLHKRQQA